MFKHTGRSGRLVLLTLLVSLLVLAGACTSAPASDVDAAEDPDDTPVTTADGEEESGEEEDGTIVIQALTRDPSAPARVNNFSDAADSLNDELEAEGSDTRVSVEAIIKPMGDGEFDQHLIFAAQSGNASDIYATGYTKVGWLAEAGYIQPLEDIRDAPVFDDLLEGYWDPVTYDGRIWGVIQDTEARGVLFNKAVLRELGWSEDDIEGLPDRMENGDFLIEDLTNLAREAVEAGITEYGLAHSSGGGAANADLGLLYASHGAEYYDDEAGTFILDRDAMGATFEWLRGLVEEGLMPAEVTDTPKIDLLADLMNSRSLFMTAGIWDEAKFRNRGIHDEFGDADEEWVLENIGIGLMPAADSTIEPVTFSNPWVYVVSTHAEDPELVQRLLTHVSAPELQAKHGVESAHIPFTLAGQQEPAIQENAWLNQVSYLINYSRFMPKDPDSPIYGDLMLEVIGAVETGALEPDEAVDWLATEMERRLENVDIR